MKNPLYNKVQKIVSKKAVSGTVKQSDFSSIRNQASVRAILTDMGYEPSNEIRPFTWSLPKYLEIKDPIVDGRRRTKKGYISVALGESVCGEIRRRFLDNELLKVDDIAMKRSSVITFMHKLRTEGHKMQVNRYYKSRKVESFRLISEQ